jgi:hypothetical protein
MYKSKFDINKPIKVNPKYDRIEKTNFVVQALTKYGGIAASYFEVEIVYRKQNFKGVIYDIELVNNCISPKSNFVKKHRALKKIFETIIGKYQKQQIKLEI